MSFAPTTPNWVKLSAIFDRIITEHERVSRAPDFSTLKERASSEENLANIMQQEARKQYKAIDTKTGDVYLTQNPALMSYQIHMAKGERLAVKRQIPQFYMSYHDATELGKASMRRSAESQPQLDYHDIGADR